MVDQKKKYLERSSSEKTMVSNLIGKTRVFIIYERNTVVVE